MTSRAGCIQEDFQAFKRSTLLIPQALKPGPHGLVFIEIFARNIVFRYFVRANFLLVGVIGTLHTGHDIGLECVSFLDQFVDTLRIRTFNVR